MLQNLIFEGTMLFNNIFYGGMAGIKQCFFNENDWDFVTSGGDGGAFDKVAKNVEQTGASFTRLTKTLAISVITAAIIVFGMQLVLGRNGQKKQELKDHIPWLLLGVVLVIGFTLVFTIADSIVNGLQSDLGS